MDDKGGADQVERTARKLALLAQRMHILYPPTFDTLGSPVQQMTVTTSTISL